MLVTVPDLGEQRGDLLIDRVAGLGPERFDRAQVDGQGVGRPIAADEVGEGEPLAFVGGPGSSVPRGSDVTIVDQRTDPDRAIAPAEVGAAGRAGGGGIASQQPQGSLRTGSHCPALRAASRRAR